MTRKQFVVCLCGLAGVSRAFGQQKPPGGATQTPPASSTPTAPSDDEQMPPEEDESLAPEKFPLNPLESERNIKVGNYYWHRGKFRAALERYERAAKYNPSSPEAFFKVGEAEEKLKNGEAARAAFQRVLQVAPDSKEAHDAKKKLSQLKS